MCKHVQRGSAHISLSHAAVDSAQGQADSQSVPRRGREAALDCWESRLSKIKKLVIIDIVFKKKDSFIFCKIY